MKKFINGKWTELLPVKPTVKHKKVEHKEVVQENQQEQEPELPVETKAKITAKKKSVLDVFKKKKK